MVSRQLLIVILAGWTTLGSASVKKLERMNPSEKLDAQLSTLHHSVPVSRLQSGKARCEKSWPAEALATPDPLTDKPVSKARIAVSFIIGTDGRVHSPIILEGAGEGEDRSVLDTMLSWRYRPATCNSVPTETESKVEFSIH